MHDYCYLLNLFILTTNDESCCHGVQQRCSTESYVSLQNKLALLYKVSQLMYSIIGFVHSYYWYRLHIFSFE